MRALMLSALASSVVDAVPQLTGVVAWAAVVPTPQTAVGREIEALLLALRPALVLMPVAIMVEVVRRIRRERHALPPQPTGACDRCGVSQHAPDATYCRRCGERLSPAPLRALHQ